MGADGSAAVADADLAADLRDPGYHHHCKNRDYHTSSAESGNTTIPCLSFGLAFVVVDLKPVDGFAKRSKLQRGFCCVAKVSTQYYI